MMDAWHEVSIHAPRAGSDDVALDGVSDDKVSIHAPRAGSDVLAD